MNKPVNIAIVDDELLFLSGLKVILSEDQSLQVVTTANSGDAFVQWLEENDTPLDVVLLDMRMKGMTGIETVHAIKASHPDLKVMILSTYYRDSFLGYMIKLGVSAFLPKNLDPALLIEIIKKVAAKGLYLTEDQLQEFQQHMVSNQRAQLPQATHLEQLTKREHEILRLICDQYTSPEIAEKLFISIRTVEGHRKNLLEKTEAKNTVGLVFFALTHNLIDVDQKLLQYTLS